MRHALRTVVGISLLTLVLSACGGGGGGGGSSTPDADVGGWWRGTTTIAGQGTFDLIGLVAEDGRAFFLQGDGVMYWGTVHASGSRISSSVTGAGLLGLPLYDGSASGTGSVTGTVRERASISADSSFTTSAGSRTTGTISLVFDGLYNDDSSLGLIAGNYVDALGLYGGVLNIAGNGDLFMQDPASKCVLNGRVAIINAAYNAYDIQFSYSDCEGPNAVFNGVTFRGLASYEQASSSAIALVQGSIAGTPYANAFVFTRT